MLKNKSKHIFPRKRLIEFLPHLFLVFEVVVNQQGVLLRSCLLDEHLIQCVPVDALFTHLSHLVEGPEILVLEDVPLSKVDDRQVI